MTEHCTEELPGGLRLLENVITPRQEQKLIELIEEGPLEYPPYDPDNRRSSTSYGWKYDYAADTFRPCPAVPDGLLPVLRVAAEIAGIAPDEIAECLLNRYEPGAIIQPHLDKPVWDHVIGVSLGAPAVMRFDREEDDLDSCFDVTLPPRSAYLLAGESRHHYRHSLPAVHATRWSITFRTFSALGRWLFNLSVID